MRPHFWKSILFGSSFLEKNPDFFHVTGGLVLVFQLTIQHTLSCDSLPYCWAIRIILQVHIL